MALSPITRDSQVVTPEGSPTLFFITLWEALRKTAAFLDRATFTAPPVVPTYTVATLPATATAGARAYVTDATATTFASVVAGGGTNKVPVYGDGTNWRIG